MYQVKSGEYEIINKYLVFTSQTLQKKERKKEI